MHLPGFSRRGSLVGAAVAASAALALSVPPALAATSYQDTQANEPQVADDGGSDTTARFPTNKQNEPSIAIEPGSSNMIAGSNDEQEQPACGDPSRASDPTDCSFVPGVGTDGVYTSTDGTHWTNRGLLDDGQKWKDSPFVSDGDPVIVYGPRYNADTGKFSTTETDAYYQSLASYKPGKQPGNQAPEFIVVSRSANNGANWSGPSVIASGGGYTFNDKNAMWADKNPTSPYYGRLYASWTQFRGIPGTAEPVRVSYSADGGRTWSVPRQLSGASNNQVTGGRQGSAVRTDGHGNVYVAWEDGGHQVYAVSRDGGVSYSRPRAIGRVSDLIDPIPGSNFRNDSFLSLASDPRPGSRTLYAAWVNRTSDDGSSGELVVYRTDGAGWSKVATPASGSVGDNPGNPDSFAGVPFFQGLDVSDTGRVDVGWQAMTAKRTDTFGTGNAEINSWFASSDPGEPFTTPTLVSSRPSDPAVSAQNNLQRQFWGDYNTLVSQGGHAWFIYTDGRNGAGCPAVDEYQRYLVSSGAKIEQEERQAQPKAGKNGPADGDKPAPPNDCSDQQFGNTDVFVSAITP